MITQMSLPLRPCVRRAKAEYADNGTRAVKVGGRLRMTPFVLAAAVCALSVPLVVMLSMRTDSGLAEWWTTHIARALTVVFGTLTSWLYASVLELLFVAIVAAGVFLIVRLEINLCTARFKAILTGVLAVAVGGVYVLDMYIATMGFGYYRAKMPLVASGDKYTAAQTVTVSEYFLADYNALAAKFERDDNGCVICPYGFFELAGVLRDEYERLDDGYFFSYTPTAKPIQHSAVLSAFMITGITFLPTGEANVNVAAPPCTVTYTMAHELAHTKGVQREGDANLISFYILLSSKNDYLRYCGYIATFYNLLAAIPLASDDRSEYVRLLGKIDFRSRNEISFAAKYWNSQPDIMGKIGEFINNLYLTVNGAENGTGSYGDGNKTEVITPTDPETGKPAVNPDTGKPIKIPKYSELQKVYFYLYEQVNGVPEGAEPDVPE